MEAALCPSPRCFRLGGTPLDLWKEHSIRAISKEGRRNVEAEETLVCDKPSRKIRQHLGLIYLIHWTNHC